jgi:hypothetical protein
VRRAIPALAVLLAAATLAPSASAGGKKCVEVSDIVGHEKCKRFGDDWSTESRVPFAVGVETMYLAFNPIGHEFLAHAGKSGPTLYTYDGARLGTSNIGAVGPMIRIAGYIFPSLYLGFEYGIGVGRNEPAALQAGVWSLRPAGGVADTFAMAWTGLAGARLPLGRFSLRGEMVLGGYVVSLRQEGSTVVSHDTNWASAATWTVEPRVAVDFWATPWFTLGGFYGRNLVDRGTQTFGLSLMGHVRSFDGSFSL